MLHGYCNLRSRQRGGGAVVAASRSLSCLVLSRLGLLGLGIGLGISLGVGLACRSDCFSHHAQITTTVQTATIGELVGMQSLYHRLLARPRGKTTFTQPSRDYYRHHNCNDHQYHCDYYDHCDYPTAGCDRISTTATTKTTATMWPLNLILL